MSEPVPVERYSAWAIAMVNMPPITQYVLATDYDTERTLRLQAEQRLAVAVEALNRLCNELTFDYALPSYEVYQLSKGELERAKDALKRVGGET